MPWGKFKSGCRTVVRRSVPRWVPESVHLTIILLPLQQHLQQLQLQQLQEGMLLQSRALGSSELFVTPDRHLPEVVITIDEEADIADCREDEKDIIQYVRRYAPYW